MRPVSFCTFASSSESFRLSATGISICTCLPARMHCSPCFACICVGVARIAASTPGCARHSSRLLDQCGMLNFFATSAVDSGLPPASVTTSMPSIFWIASRCLTPKAPCPAIRIFISTRLEDDAANRSGRCRDVIEAVALLDTLPERAAHDEPHHELDRLVTGLAQVVEWRDLHERFGITRQPIEKRNVELLVHQTRARTLD